MSEPCESGSLFRLSAKSAGEPVKRLLGVLNRIGGEIVEGVAEIDAGAVVQGLMSVIEAEGFEVVRRTRSGFSVTSPEMNRNVRFRYTRKMMGYEDEKGVDADADLLRERMACMREKLMLDMGRYHAGGVAGLRSGLDEGGSPLYGCHGIPTKGGKWDLTF